MTVKTDDSRGDIYKNDKNAELRCGPAPILYAAFVCFSKIPSFQQKNYKNFLIKISWVEEVFNLSTFQHKIGLGTSIKNEGIVFENV